MSTEPFLRHHKFLVTFTMEGNGHLDIQPLNTKDPKGTQGFVQKYLL